MDCKDRKSVSKILKAKWPKLMNRLFQDDLLFFMHIPKTAGTSFRFGAEEFFGKKFVDYDYGEDSLVTTEAVRRYIYNGSPDPWSYLATCRKQGTRMIGGHMNIDKYVTLSGINRTITFIRDPFQRLASEYAHVVRHKDYPGTFRDFYTKSYMKNTMSWFFSNIDVEAVGFIGISEKYEACLNVINERYGLDIMFRKDNCSRVEQADLHEISGDDLDELKRLNTKDMALYEYCGELLDMRLQMIRAGRPFAHAHMKVIDAKTVSGWAWWGNDCTAPVDVEIMINGVVREKACATELRRNLSFLQPPRRGYVGFEIPVEVKEGDLVQCRIEQTGQLFPPSPICAKIT